MSEPMSRERVLELILEVCDDAIAADFPQYLQKLRDTDAALREELAVALETIEKQGADFGFCYRAKEQLRAEVDGLKKKDAKQMREASDE